MTRDDIIRMAREAGGCFEELPLCDAWLFYEDEHLERFAALVAEREREACAKVAESYEPRCEACPGGVSNAIRARRET